MEGARRISAATEWEVPHKTAVCIPRVGRCFVGALSEL